MGSFSHNRNNPRENRPGAVCVLGMRGRRLVPEDNAVVEYAQPDCIGATVPQEPGDGHDEVRQFWMILNGVSNGLLDFPSAGVAVPRSVRVPPSLTGGAICVTMETLNHGGWRGALFNA